MGGHTIGSGDRKQAVSVPLWMPCAAAMVLFLPIFTGCRTGAAAGRRVSSFVPPSPVHAEEKPEPAVPPPDRSAALAHFATAVSLDLEAARLEQIFDYQRLSTGTRQPSLKRDASRLRNRAVSELDAALVDDPGSAVILRRKGDVLMELGRVDEAVNLYRQAGASMAARPRWYFQTAGRLELLGRLEDAEGILRSAVDDPSILPGGLRKVALLELGRIYDSLGRFEEAEAALREALAQGSLPNASVRASLGMALADKIEKDPTGIRRLLVGILIKQGKFEEAVAEARLAAKEAPWDPRAAGVLAEAYKAAGKTAEAISAAQSFVKSHPSNQLGVLNLMRLLASGGQTDKAIEAGRKYLESNGDDARVQAVVFKLYKDAGRTDEAEKFALSGRKGKPSYPAALGLLDVYIQGGRGEKAFSLAENILRNTPLDDKVALQVVARLWKGLSAEKAKQFVEGYSHKYADDMRASYALARILAGKGKVKEAGRIFVSLARRRAPYGDVYEGAALSLLDGGDAYQAAILFLNGIDNGFVARPENMVGLIVDQAKDPEKVAERLEKHIGDYDSALTELYEIVAGLYSRSEKNAKAEQFYRKALEDPSPRLQDYAGLALCLYRQEKVSEAIGFVEDLIHKGQGAPPLVRMLVTMLTEDGRYDQAKSLAAKLIAEQPTDIDNRIVLANVYIGSEDYKAAERQLLSARDLAEGDKESMIRVRYFLGIVYDDQGKEGQALSMWRANLQAAPDDADSNNALAYHFAESGTNLDEALAHVRKALAADPENAAYLDTLGWIYYKRGETDKALENLKKAAEKMPDADIFDHLGDALSKSGDRQGALAAWRKALSNKPKSKARVKIKKKIEAYSPTPAGDVKQGGHNVGP